MTHRLFTPGTTDGDYFFTVEELLLKTLQKRNRNTLKSVCMNNNNCEQHNVCACLCLPFHTVYISPPVSVCEPSDVSVCFAVRGRNDNHVNVFSSHTVNRIPKNDSLTCIKAHIYTDTHLHLGGSGILPL